MRKMLPLLLCLLAIALVFVSCTNAVDGETSTLRLSIDAERSGTVAPDGTTKINEIKKYVFSLVRISDSTELHNFVMTKNESGTYTMTGIVPGSYKIIVTGKNSEDKIIAQTTLNDVILQRGMNSFSVSLNTHYSESKGNLSLSITLPSNYGVKNSISAKLYPMVGEAITLSPSVSGTTATVEKANLNIGSYRLEVIVSYNGTPFFGLNDVVVIAPDKTTTMKVDASGGEASAEGVGVSEKIYTPLEGTLSFTKASGRGNLKLNLTITSDVPESIYRIDESTKRNIIIDWYCEDIKVETTTVVYDPSNKSFSSQEFSAFYGPANYSAIFYMEGVPGSMGSAKKTINYDPTTGNIV